MKSNTLRSITLAAGLGLGLGLGATAGLASAQWRLDASEVWPPVLEDLVLREIGLVPSPVDRGQGVLGVTLDTGNPAAGLGSLVAALEHATADGEVIALEIDPEALRPDAPEFLCHMGSLTIPPCTAGAHWRLYEEVIDAGPAQRTAMRTQVDALAAPAETELPEQQPAPAVR